MGLFGGDKSTSTSSTLSSQSQTGDSLVAGGNITVSDKNSINKAFGFGKKSLELSNRVFNTSIKSAFDVVDKITKLANKTIDTSDTNTKRALDSVSSARRAADTTANESLIKIALVVAGGIAVAFAAPALVKSFK